MTHPIETLILSAHDADVFKGKSSCIFLNAQHHEVLQKHSNITCIQHFYPYSKTLLDSLYTTYPTLNDIKNTPYDTALILLPQNIAQARYNIAQALTHLNKNGILICAAANNAGGKRLKSLLKEFKIHSVSYTSKHKAKAAYCKIDSYDQNSVTTALKTGQLQFIENTGCYSQAGIYGWNKIDTGSRTLIKHIDQKTLSGHGADFGCGYGYLTKNILNATNAIERLTCIDADYRALHACKENTRLSKTHIEYIWDDLTDPDHPPQGLDFIVMNPPFHQGKTTDISIGQRFINTAAKALNPGGTLWMVANTHLPYEKVLSGLFTSTTPVAQEQGFKVLKAIK